MLAGGTPHRAQLGPAVTSTPSRGQDTLSSHSWVMFLSPVPTGSRLLFGRGGRLIALVLPGPAATAVYIGPTPVPSEQMAVLRPAAVQRDRPAPCRLPRLVTVSPLYTENQTVS